MNELEKTEWRATKENPFWLSAGCLVFRENSENKRIEITVCVVNKSNIMKKITLPGGTIRKKDESPEQAAIRETFEESGRTGEILEFLGSTENDDIHTFYKTPIIHTTLWFSMKFEKDFNVHDDEEDEVLWVEINDAREKLAKFGNLEQVKIVENFQKLHKINFC